ncbi:hypothetical protein Bca4012_024059 [Brassica carinata]
MRVETDSDSDSDDDMLVPVFRTPVDVSGRGKRPMWSRLIFGIPGIPNTVVQYDDITAPAPPAQYIRSSHPSTEAVDNTLLDDTSPSVCQEVGKKAVVRWTEKAESFLDVGTAKR